MKNVIASIVAAAGIAAVASADTSQLNMQVSLDGINWSSAVDATPGSTVQFRGVMNFVQTGTVTPTGFATLTWQPTISNWTGADTLAAFADRGNNSNGGTVADVPGMPAPYGRISPFGSTGPTTSDPYRGHVQMNAGTNYLRIARTTITNWVGEGATTGTSASNNFNGSGGLACVQKGFGNVSPTDPPFNPAITNVVLFKAAITLSSDTAARVLTVDAPTSGMSRNSTTGEREAAWFNGTADNFGGLKAAVQVGTGTISVVPTPGALALLGMGGLALGRRRR